MSLLRVCAFAKCLSRRRFLEKCASVGVSNAGCCQLCVSVRSATVRRISGTPLQLQKINISSVIPKTEDAKKRVLEQSQLLDVLKARIQQLQSDTVLDVHHAEVQFLKAPSHGKSSARGPRSTPQEKTDIPKTGQTVAKVTSKSQPNCWTAKLIQEKKIKTLQKIQYVLKKNPVKSPPKNFSEVKKIGGQMEEKKIKTLQKIQYVVKKTPVKSRQKIFSKVKKIGGQMEEKKIKTLQKIQYVVKKETVKSKKKLSSEVKKIGGQMELSATSASVTAGTAAAGKATEPQKLSEKNPDSKKLELLLTHNEQAKMDWLENRSSQQVSQSANVAKHPQLASENVFCRDITVNICSYLEACVFMGDIERAHHFLLSWHRILTRRKRLSTRVYNILMKEWAKKGMLHQIGHIFILLSEAGLKPNLESYCSALECMGRNPKSFPKDISRCLAHMKEDGLSLDDLFNQCVFRQDEWDMVLNAIRVVQPDYEPTLNLHTSQCSSPLVQDFYTKREDHTFPKLDFTQKELQKRFQHQLSVERSCTITIDSVEATKPVTENMAKMRELLAEQRQLWRNVLLHALRESKKILANTSTKHYKFNIYPYLCLLTDAEYVDIMIQSVSSLPPSGEPLTSLAQTLSERIYTKYAVQQNYKNQTVKKLGRVYNAYTALLAKDTKVYSVLPREQWCKLEVEHISGPTLHGGTTSWPYDVTLELGTYLVEIMVKHQKINSNILNPAHQGKLIPILYHMYIYRNIRQIRYIKPHPVLTQIHQEAMDTKLTFDSYVMPMVCPPIPWTSVKFGAYLLTPSKLMRAMAGATQHDQLLEKCQNLQAALDSLNQLGNCAWRINKPVLDIIISIFNDRGSDKLDIPPPMSEAPKIPYFSPHNYSYTSAEKAQMKREILSAKKKCNEMHSLRMDALYKLSIANYMRDEIFWFPHNMDFRGRTYPCPPHFNHLGNDVTRATLIFAEGKPLGPKGLDWLKIHLVNLTGLKKRSSIQERLEYANTIMEDILDSADNPLNGKKWWMDADEPCQALACCMEIANAVRSPDHTQFVSHFPIHQDGSCNGLQHYAALGRDVIGAKSVNLMPCDLPQDVYSSVAQQVEEFRARDAENGLKVAQVLEGFISRKVVKQTVMTVVYGVTRYGGRLQIEKKLKEFDEFPEEYIWEASHYLVRLVFCGLKEMFTGTREIQDWLTDSARHISKMGHAVEWVTPLGLPIIQPYHRNQVLRSTMQNVSIQISHDITQKPNVMKQKNAFPPNFIHSLDSTHMMLTSLHCYSGGLTFVSVHDCFWTHALTVETMNKACREQFVALHSQPILEELSNFLVHKYCSKPPAETSKKRYQDYKRLRLLLSSLPQRGDFDLQQVKDSIYFFS
ncbi:DNA-directed RNA polymerase, mitochondrial isoform 2-T2 [Pholidichthys leucotaenia]